MHLPHVSPFARAPIYFFTLCAAARRPVLASQTVIDELRSIWLRSGDRDGWHVGAFLIMPDHVHFFAQTYADAVPRPKWIKMVKSVSSRALLARLSLSPPFWQAESFDHILRSEASWHQKWEYVQQNPVRAGLVSRREDWIWRGEIEPLRWSAESRS